MQVMKNGAIIQSAVYGDLLDSCSDFSALVAAHHSSMEAPGVKGHTVQNTENSAATIDSKPIKEDSNTADIAPSNEAGSSKLIEEEETESGQVSWHAYKLYITQAWGWWGVVLILAISVLTEGSRMASNYWLSYESSGGTIFDISMFLGVYASIVSASVVFQFISLLFIAFLGLKSAQAFFGKMFNTPSVRFYKASQTAEFELFSTLSEFTKMSYISEHRE